MDISAAACIFFKPTYPNIMHAHYTEKRTGIYSFYTRTRRVELYVDNKREKKLNFHSRRVSLYKSFFDLGAAYRLFFPSYL